jgi:hypothetical protein
MTCDPHWTAYLSALLTPVVAVIVAFIAYRQWRLAQNKLKLDLFDKRFIVYLAARDLLASIMTSGQAKNDEVFKYMAATREAKWLLSPTVAEYLDKKLYHKAIDLQRLDVEIDGLQGGEVRTKKVYEASDIKKWFMDQYNVLDEQFAPFLRLSH